MAASVQLQVCCWAVLPAGSLPGQAALQHKGRCQSPPSIHEDELHQPDQMCDAQPHVSSTLNAVPASMQHPPALAPGFSKPPENNLGLQGCSTSLHILRLT